MKTFCLSLAAAALLLSSGPLLAGPETFVAGQKLDSGLGELPHYSRWRNHVAGESMDDGLGELPHYSKWADASGRDPLGRAGTPVALNSGR